MVVFIIPGLYGSDLYSGTRKVYPPNLSTMIMHKLMYPRFKTKWQRDFDTYINNANEKLMSRGIIKTYAGVNIYNKIYKMFSSLYGENDIIEFGYDWRQPIDTIADELSKFIINNLMMHTMKINKRVVFFAHSMGGMVLKVMLEKYRFEEWLFDVIGKHGIFIFHSTPVYGQKYFHDFLFNPNAVNDCVKTKIMLPNTFFFDDSQVRRLYDTFKYSYIRLIRKSDVFNNADNTDFVNKSRGSLYIFAYNVDNGNGTCFLKKYVFRW